MHNLTHFIHKFFLPLLLLSYVLAGLAPEAGLAIRQISFGTIDLPALGKTNFSISLLMLSFLLFNAGLGIKTKELVGLTKKPLLITLGFLANILMPVILVAAFHGLLIKWHNPDELQNLLVGLALIAAMPIAGSSATWAQNANGNLGLSLGLVLASTILSPLSTPVVLHLYGFLTHGDYSEDLHELAQQGTNAFLCLTVVLPSLLGLATHWLLGEEKTAHIKPHLKLINFLVLLTLNYSNASISLPEVFTHPDWDLLGFILLITCIICGAAFSTGWLLSRLFKTDLADRAALMFSLGMNNNGTGLVLASSALTDHPAVLVPLILYTLVQQVFAASIDSYFFRARAEA